ncbi:MAG: leucine-rich repeat domain-containing protein [Methanobrevibacter sp.]|nr:leucine-rich repeat domain-containing protein [Methanobrevibacter sp.]
MGILLEAVAQDGINYRDIYNSVGKATDNFTKPSGSFKYETNFEANLAKQILSDKYSRVYIKPLNMKNENELLYTVFFNGVIEDEPEEMAESLLESYLLKEDVEDDKEFVKQALIDHHELRELISKNKWEDLWKSIQKIYTRDSSLTPVQGGTLAIGKFIKVFSKAGVNYTIEVIPEYCFIASTDLTSFKIPDGTKVIGLAAFEKCVNLETVEIPESVTDIHNSAFRGCHSLKNIKLPSKLRIVAPDLFRACKSLQEIIIPENCIAIMDSAFRGCSSLKEVVVPKSCTSIGPGAFYHCNLESITLPDKKYYYMENMKKIGIDNMKKKNIHFSESLVEKIVKKGSQWQVQSEKGKNMGTYDTKEEAEKRLKQVEYFKHINEDDFEFMPDKNPAGTPLGNGTGLGEAFDDEEIEFCPICDRQMDFIGYQGNLSEFKCKTCNKYFYFDENGNEVDLGEDLNERFYNKERKEIEDTLLDGEPTFGEWLGQVYGMTEDEVEVEPEVEKYYLDSYSDYLNHLYDLDPVEYESDRPDDKRDFEYVALCSFEDWDKEGTSTEYFHTIEDAINWCNQEMADKGYDYVDIFEWGGVQGSTVATFYNGKWNTDYGEDDGESLNESPEDSDYGSIAPEAEVRDSVYQKQFNEMHETLVVSTKALLTSNSALSRLEKLRRNIGNVISNLGIDVNTLCKFAKPKSNTGYNDIATIKMGSMLKPVDFHITTGQIGEDGTPSILEINVDLFGMFTGWVSAPSNEYQYDDNYQDPKKLSAAVNFCDEQYSEQIIETLFERAYETLDRAVDKYGYAFKNESLTEALSPEKFSKALYNMDELGLTSDLSEAQFSYALNGIFGAELKRMKSPNYDKFMNGFYGDFTEVYPLLDVQGKQAATDFLVAHIFLPNSEGSEGREKAFIEEW